MNAPVRSYPIPAPEEAQLLAAAKAGDGHAVARLIAARVNVEARDLEGKTPLMLAARHGICGGSAGVIFRLRAAGADVNAIIETIGHTALAFAIFRNNIQGAAALLEGQDGADVSLLERIQFIAGARAGFHENLRSMAGQHPVIAAHSGIQAFLARNPASGIRPGWDNPGHCR